MKTEKIVLVMTVMTVLLSGCLNISSHIHSGRTYTAYSSTRGYVRGIVEAFSEKPEWHDGSAGEAKISSAYSLLCLPLFVIGLPLEAVADTITLPYDLTNQ